MQPKLAGHRPDAQAAVGDAVNGLALERIRKVPALNTHQTLLSSSEKLAWVSTKPREDQSPSGKWASNETERDFCDLVDSASIPDHTFAYAMIGICRGQNELGRIVVLFDRRTAAVEEPQAIACVSDRTELIATFPQLHGGVEVYTMEIDASHSPLTQHRFWLRSGRTPGTPNLAHSTDAR